MGHVLFNNLVNIKRWGGQNYPNGTVVRFGQSKTLATICDLRKLMPNKKMFLLQDLQQVCFAKCLLLAGWGRARLGWRNFGNIIEPVILEFRNCSPDGFPSSLNHCLLLGGCCWECPLLGGCAYFHLGRPRAFQVRRCNLRNLRFPGASAPTTSRTTTPTRIPFLFSFILPPLPSFLNPRIVFLNFLLSKSLLKIDFISKNCLNTSVDMTNKNAPPSLFSSTLLVHLSNLQTRSSSPLDLVALQNEAVLYSKVLGPAQELNQR